MNKLVGYVGLQRFINNGSIIEFLLVHTGSVAFQVFGHVGHNQPPHTTTAIGDILNQQMMDAYTMVSDDVLAFLYTAYQHTLTVKSLSVAPVHLPTPVLGLPTDPSFKPPFRLPPSSK